MLLLLLLLSSMLTLLGLAIRAILNLKLQTLKLCILRMLVVFRIHSQIVAGFSANSTQ